MIRTFRYPLNPTKEQFSILENWLRDCQQIYNAALEERINAYQKTNKSISRYDQQKSLTQIRKDDSYWQNIPAVILRSPLKRLDLAYRAFFRRIKSGEKPGFPRFKSRNRYNSFSLTNAIPSIQHRMKGQSAKIRIPKIGWIKFHEYRPLKYAIKDIIIKKETENNWVILFQCDLGKPSEKIIPNKSIGIDVGLKSFITLSNGEKIDNPKFFRKSQQILKRRQQNLQRKKFGSNSRKRAKLLVQKAHLKVKNQRKDFARKLAKSLFNQYDLISYENLDIRNMIGGYLDKSIYDAAWSIFIHCLECKAEEAGKIAIGIDPSGTTQRCSGCNSIIPKELKDREHICDRCGLRMDRDENAAINIKALGLSAVKSRSIKDMVL